MINSFKPIMSILPPAQQEIWVELKLASTLGLVLYGGTAIALKLGHRESIDFYFFSEKPLDREAIKNAFPFMAQATILQDKPNSLSVLVTNSNSEYVKLSFFGEIAFGRVGSPDITEDGVLQVASLDDLMATKVKAILQRVEAKDYRDIASMVNAGVSLSKGLASACKMFGKDFQPSESLKAMVYFRGGDLNTLTEDEKKTIVTAVSNVGDLPIVDILSHKLTAIERSLLKDDDSEVVKCSLDKFRATNPVITQETLHIDPTKK